VVVISDEDEDLTTVLASESIEQPPLRLLRLERSFLDLGQGAVVDFGLLTTLGLDWMTSAFCSVLFTAL
jgi:hypothetical protein